jgi:hypothetical protein
MGAMTVGTVAGMAGIIMAAGTIMAVTIVGAVTIVMAIGTMAAGNLQRLDTGKIA